ncbi:MAG TPA: FAD binding domain-containing protein [Flexilinea sp.]|jgi:CO/xanthine dehydrogenase FAD-binding subunit|nr:FAD binding domain-containing protein [Flexilinea sp.]HNY18811.1 FAD binding domain-containing protein [Flexilinea sp.]HOP02371.1 FAD binding domain-containing protein [Flexilinea sp.]HOW07886.1 FAD binding domain-containing protein [Flexilinea sp.]HPJ66041.1 FAD binding domain-containing protein [Flexilinea sp.]
MMKYYRPETVKKTLKLLGSQTEVCTLLYFPPRAKHLSQWQGDALIDLSNLGLDTIKEKSKEIAVGSMVSFETLVKSEIIRNQWDGVLSDAAHLSATGAMRNLSTVGGILLNPNFPAEVILVFLALDAMVVLLDENGKEVRIPIEAFLDNGKPTLERGMLIKEVILPIRKNIHCALERVSRSKSDGSIVSVVVKGELTQKTAHNVRIAVFGANPTPKRYHSAESYLSDKPFTYKLAETIEEIIQDETEAVGDYRGSAEYREAMAGVLTKRALISLKKMMKA